jgi:hypothetical protein
MSKHLSSLTVTLATLIVGVLALSFVAGCGSSDNTPNTLTVTIYHVAGDRVAGSIIQGSTDPKYIEEQWHITNADLVKQIYQATLALPPKTGGGAIIPTTEWTLFTFQRDNTIIAQMSEGPEAVSGLMLGLHDIRTETMQWIHLLQQAFASATPYINPTYTPGV